jgi:hypothetical protein
MKGGNLLFILGKKRKPWYIFLVELLLVYAASYPMDTGGSFPGGKARPGRDADHSPPSSAEVTYE